MVLLVVSDCREGNALQFCTLNRKTTELEILLICLQSLFFFSPFVSLYEIRVLTADTFCHRMSFFALDSSKGILEMEFKDIFAWCSSTGAILPICLPLTALLQLSTMVCLLLGISNRSALYFDYLFMQRRYLCMRILLGQK